MNCTFLKVASEADSRLDLLRAENTQLRSTSSVAEGELLETKTQCVELRKHREELLDENKQLQDQIIALNARVGELAADLKSSVETAKRLEEELEAAQTAHDEALQKLKSEHDALAATKSEESEREVEQLRQAHRDELEKVAEQHNADVQRIVRELKLESDAKLSSTISTYEPQLAALTNSKLELVARVKELDTLRESHQKLSAENEQLKADLATTLDQQVSLSTELNTLQMQKSSAGESQTRVEAELRQVREKHDSQAAANEKLQRELDIVSDRLIQAQRKHKTELSDLETHLRAQMMAQVEPLEAERNELRTQLEVSIYPTPTEDSYNIQYLMLYLNPYLTILLGMSFLTKYSTDIIR